VADARPTVALDGFGVEGGFEVLASGIAAAAADGITTRVFGPVDEIAPRLPGVDLVEVIDTSEAIANEDEPVGAVRSRPDASIVRAVSDVAQGRSEAVVSLGSTGAAMAAATFGLKRIRGVKRPALAAQVPLPGRTVLFLDVGANVEVRARHLVQFACLGAAFMSAAREVETPQVGLLNVGEEREKGRPVDREAIELLEAIAGEPGFEAFEFLGNLEGRDLPAGVADVIVTDGFTGNVVLKAMEGAVATVTGAIRDAARSNPVAGVGGLLMRPALGGLKRDLHPDTTGGAILLGLRKTAVIGHGSSGSDGVANAIRLAAESVEGDAPGRTAALLESTGLDRRERDSGQ
jgi:glycerol-3-phosphate acyltransferase PlsX